MKGCARTCILQLLGWAAAAYAFYFYFRSIGDLGPPLYWASIAAGLFVMLAVGYALAIRELVSERSILLAADSGTPPPDGKWVAVSGHIHSMQSLRAPFTGEDVVAYQYKISRHERSGKSSTEVTYYEGKALVPSTIATRHGTVRLLSVPTFDLPPATFPRYQDAVANANAYISATTFETKHTPKEQRIGMDEEHADDDGNFKVDKRKFVETDVDINGMQLSEQHVKQNAVVCAFGLYSQQRGGLIPYPNWAKQTRLMLGDAHAVANQLRNRILKYCIGIVCFSAAAYGVVKLYVANVPAAS